MCDLHEAAEALRAEHRRQERYTTLIALLGLIGAGLAYLGGYVP